MYRKTVETNDSIKKAFLQGCREGDLVKIKACITLNVDINTQEDKDNYVREGYTGLHYAVRYSNVQVLDLLLSKPNINVNIKNYLGQTPFLACFKPELMVRLCRVPSFNVHLKDDNGETALIRAVAYGSARVLELLRQLGITNWNSKDRFGNCAMTEAVKWGKSDMLKILIEVPGINLNVRDSEGKHITHIAVDSKYDKIITDDDAIKCVELLNKDPRVDWNVKNRNGETPLQVALRNKKEAIARILLDNPNLDNSFISPILVKIISEKAKITISKSSKRKRIETPECPVCFENFNSGQQVWQCSKGHFVCEDCVSGIQSCPQCRGRIVGRSFGFENFLKTLDV